MDYRIVIIGAGEIGGAIEGLLSGGANVLIEMWDKDDAKVSNKKPLSDIVPLANFVFLCVPSWAMRDALIAILPHLGDRVIVVSLAKGITIAPTEERGEKRLKTTAELLEKLLPDSADYALLSGPMIAEELMHGAVSVGVVASRDKKVFDKIEALFVDTNLRVEYSSDIYGVALMGVLKNIYAISLGIADALGLGSNFRGYLVWGAIKEMAEITKLLGEPELLKATSSGGPALRQLFENQGKQGEVALGLAGLGDLVTTGFSPHSRNRQVGDRLVKTGESSLKSEGLASLPLIVELLGKNVNNFPILRALEEVVIQNRNAKITFTTLIR